MYQVMVVDDEEYILKALKRTINTYTKPCAGLALPCSMR